MTGFKGFFALLRVPVARFLADFVVLFLDVLFLVPFLDATFFWAVRDEDFLALALEVDLLDFFFFAAFLVGIDDPFDLSPQKATLPAGSVSSRTASDLARACVVVGLKQQTSD